MAKNELGTKRIDPETGRKFYDLNKDPIVSPYTGTSYPRSYFESGPVVTGLPVMVSDSPECAVVLGTGRALDELGLLREVALQ